MDPLLNNNQPPKEEKMIVQGNPQEMTAQEQEADREAQGLTTPQESPSPKSQVTGSRNKVGRAFVEDDSPSPAIKKGEKITVAQFSGMAATSPDVNALFHKHLKDLASPYATAIEMKRLGHFVDYKKEDNGS